MGTASDPFGVWGMVRLAVPVALLGCQPPGEPVVIESDRIRLFHEAQSTPCAGTLGYLDDSARYFVETLGVRLAEKIEVHLLSPGGIAQRCNDDAVACTAREDGSVWLSSDRVDVHELVHAIQFQNFGWSVPFINEGLATALGGSTAGFAEYGPPLDPLLGPAVDPGVYSIGGDLVAYLLLEFGPEPILEWLASTDAEAEAEQVRANFVDAFGVSIDAAVQERLASGWTFDGPSLRIDRCASEPVPWVGDRWETAASVVCDDDGVGRGVFRYASFEVSEGALFEVEGRVPAFVGRCLEQDHDDVQLLRINLRNTDKLLAHLPPGQYFVQVRDEVLFPDQAPSVVIEPVASSGTCADPVEVVAEVGQSHQMRIVPEPGQSIAIALEQPAPATGTLVGIRVFGSGAVQLCSNDCAPASCVDMADNVPISVPSDTQHFVVAASDRVATVITLELQPLQL